MSVEGPRVSVVVLAYQAAPLVARALAQALGQTLAPFEVLVVDDGSRDGTADAARAAAGGDPRVRVITKENGGIASARNRGIQESCGDYVAFLDHDDLWSPRKLEQQVALLERHPGAALASCYSALVGEDGRTLGWRVGGRVGGDVYRRMLEQDVVSGGSVAVVRRAAFAEVGGFDESLPMRSDWDMWIRLARRYDVVAVREALVGYTRSPAGASRQLERMGQAGAAVLNRAAAADPGIDERRLRYLQARDGFALLCFALFDEQRRPAWRCLGRSLALSPAPVLRSPRRWGVVGALVLLTVLPRRAYRAALGLSSRVFFGIRSGEPFPPGSPGVTPRA